MHFIELMVLFSGVASLAISALMAWLIGGVVGRPMNMMTEAMSRLAEGDHTIGIIGQEQRDRIDRMAAW